MAVVLALVAVAAALAAEVRVLDNGVRVIVEEHRASPLVASSVVVATGSMDEPAGMEGAAHLLEHLLFDGTEERDQAGVQATIDRIGGYHNATTRPDHTLFTLLVPAEHAEEGIALQAEMLFRSTLPPEQLEKERAVVAEEIARDRADPAERAREAFAAFAWAGTPLAHPVPGTAESVGAIERDALLRFYRRGYAPERMTVLVAGDIDAEAASALVERYFRAPSGDAGDATADAAPPAADWPPAPEENLAFLRVEGARRTAVFLGAPLGFGPADRETAAAELLVAALDEGPDAPLRRRLAGRVVGQSLRVAVRRAPWTTLEFEARLVPGAAPVGVLDDVARAVRSLSAPGPARDRVAAARRAAEAEELRLRDRIHYWAMLRAPALAAGRGDPLAPRFAGVDEAALDRAAERLARAIDEARVAIAGPHVEERRARWSPPAGAEGAPAAVAALIEERLDNGVRLAFRRDDASPVVGIHVAVAPRAALEPAGREGVAAVLAEALGGGTAGRGRAALGRALALLGAELQATDDPDIPFDDHLVDARSSWVRMAVPADRWREGLDLLAEVLLRPAFVEVDAARSRVLDRLERRSPGAVARLRLARELAPGHPDAADPLGTPASVRAVTADDLRAFHARALVGRHLVVAGVGAVDPRAFRDAVAEAFGALPPGGLVAAPPPAPVTAAAREVEVERGAGQSAIAVGALRDVAPVEWPALRVAVALLSERLSARLRERLGLAYSVGAALEPLAGRVWVRAGLGTRPENADRALAELRATIAAFARRPDDAEDVARTIARLRGRGAMRRMSRMSEATFLAGDLLAGRPAGASRADLDALLAVDPAAVRRAARRHLRVDRMVAVVVR